MTDTTGTTEPVSERLESWKDIAAFFGRTVRTVQRWELEERLPVHRHAHRDGRTVYAFASELSEWRAARKLPNEGKDAQGDATDVVEPAGRWRCRLNRITANRWVSAAVVLLAVLGAALLMAGWRRSAARPAPGPLRPGRLLAAYDHDLTIRVPVGRVPHDLVFTPDGNEAYVANWADHTVSVIQVSSLKVSHALKVGDNPWNLAVTLRGDSVYVAGGGGELSAIDTRTKVVTTWRLAEALSSVVATPDGEYVFVACGKGGLKRLVRRTNQWEDVPYVGCPIGLAVDAAGTRLYVNHQCGGPGGRRGHDAIAVVDPRSLALIDVFQGPPNVGSSLAMSPDSGFLWANGADACGSDYDHHGCPAVPAGIVNVLDARNGFLARSLAFPGAFVVDNVRFTPDGSRVLVKFHGDLLVQDARHFHAVELLALPGAVTAAVAPGGRQVWITSADEAAVLVLPTLPADCGPPPRGLDGLWSGDGTASDSGERLLHATETRGVRYERGIVGQAFVFDGRGARVEIQRATLASVLLGDFTLSAWVRPDSLGVEQVMADRTEDGPRDCEGWRLGILPDGRAAMRLGTVGGGRCEGGEWPLVGRTRLRTGQWAHVSVVKTATTLTMYVNGSEDAQVSHGPVVPYSDRRLRFYLGAAVTGANPFAGALDELAFHRRALPADEIRAMAAAPQSAPCRPK